MGGSFSQVKLGDVSHIIMGQSPKGETYNKVGDGIPLLNGPTEFGFSHPIPALWTTSPTRLCRQGDLLFCVRGSTTGRMNWADREYCLGRGIGAFRAKTGQTDTRFVYYILTSELSRLLSFTSGSVFPNLSRQDFERFIISWPEKHIRSAIASILGALDDKIELNRKMNETLEAMARAIFKSWFVDFDPIPGLGPHKEWLDSQLGRIPKGWMVIPLGEVIQIHDSKRIPLSSRQRATRQGQYPYYGAAKILDYVDDYLFDGIYVLVGEDGSVINEDDSPVIQYVWGKFWVSNHAHVLQGKDGVTTEHIMFFLKQTNIHAFITGAVQPKLSQTNLCRIPFLMPSQLICKRFGESIESLYARIRMNEDQSRTLASIRDALLPKLLSGEIRVKG